MPSKPSPKERAADFIAWRSRHQRQHRPVKRQPSAWWARLADRAAGEPSLIAVFIAANL